MGTKTLSESLKSNSTLTKLDLSGADERKKDTQMISIKNSLFSFLFASTENKIGDTEAASLCELFKKNTTLTELNLSGADKRKKTQMTSVNNSLFSSSSLSTGNRIGDTGATSLSESLKSNTTLTALNLWGEDKRKKTHK